MGFPLLLDSLPNFSVNKFAYASEDKTADTAPSEIDFCVSGHSRPELSVRVRELYGGDVIRRRCDPLIFRFIH